MITDQEKEFIAFWEMNRDRQKKLFYRLLIGLPTGLIFGLPILLTLIFNDWYKNLYFISSSEVIVVIIAVLAIAVFYGLFKMKFKWEENEQLYKELKFKDTNSDELIKTF